MAFLYKAFIRKNTPELRAKLEDLGYTNGAWESPRFHYPYLSVWPNPKFGLFKGEGFYMTEDDYRLDGKVWEYKPKEDVIDCGDNEELFLAIVAMRDDKDYMQWFVLDEPQQWVNIDRWVNAGDMFIVMTEHNQSDWKCHKASVEEIIEYFKK